MKNKGYNYLLIFLLLLLGGCAPAERYVAPPHEVISLHYRTEDDTYWFTIDWYEIKSTHEIKFCGTYIRESDREEGEKCKTIHRDKVSHFSISRVHFREMWDD